jgi:DNA-binding SARP family transcriptional activator/pimeloyl-ACP methyl ester carboxylesterase
MASFSVRTFGFPEVRCDDRVCPLALRKGLALLVYLAESKGPVGREAIATMLWPESPAEIVRARLRRLLHRLQLALGDGLASDRTTVRWSEAIDLEIDSRKFEEACDAGDFERACGLYHADFLDGFSPGDCPQFDEWAFFRREALRGRAIQALERVVQEKHAAGDYAAAAAHAGRLVALDPLSEMYARHLIRNLLLAGDRAAAERQLKALTQRLRDELHVAPEAETSALLEAELAEPPPTQYASGGGVHLAFQTYGSGRTDVLMLTGFVSHVERLWEEPGCRAFLSGLAGIGRLILLDRRGVGLSDRVGARPSVEATAQDIGTVLDAAGSRRVVLLGASEGGPACIKFAADHPDRVAGLILYASLAKGSAARDYPHALQADQYDIWLRQLVSGWGSAAGLKTFAPSLAGDARTRAWWAGLLRAASSPGAIKGVLEALRDTDVRHLLGRISVPTLVLHRRDDRAVRIGAGRYLASHIPKAQFVELDGADHWAFAGDQQALLASIRQFVGALAA